MTSKRANNYDQKVSGQLGSRLSPQGKHIERLYAKSLASRQVVLTWQLIGPNKNGNGQSKGVACEVFLQYTTKLWGGVVVAGVRLTVQVYGVGRR